ncbi:M12 family metallo-peptidase [Wenzhouxiangella sp. EGI_FJ10409]|uniref:M12 family metallo-peptidase n=1 Tax=Wenzhouxiangella sp. EGI_FJ10409 TaxID=3243767 RepID=UPI0035E160CD
MPHAARILALLMTATLMASATAQDGLWSSAEPIEQSLASLSPAAVEAWRINPRSGLVDDGRATLTIALPGRATLEARIKHVFRHGPDALTWTGTIEGEAGHVLLARRGEWISGVVNTATESWEIRPDAEHGQILMRIDPAGFPACGGGIDPGETMPPESSNATVAAPEEIGGDTAGVNGDKTAIDLLVVYSEAAREQLGGTAQIEAHAQAAIDNGNLALRDSLTETSWNIAHIAEIDFTETGTCGDRLGALRVNAQAQDLRDRYGADMVGMLLADGGSACGCGYVMRNPGPEFAASAFQVTANNCAVGNLTYAHEHGHNSGMEHDPANGASPGAASYDWSFGHYADRLFRTVMSYSNPCSSGCPRQPYFSNPDISFNNIPTGIDRERHNALTAALTAPIIAEFRERPVQEPELSVDPAALEPAVLAGQTAAVEMTLSNNGTAALDWTISAAPEGRSGRVDGTSNGALPWLDVDMESGSLAAGAQEVITLSLDAAELDIGEYPGRIDIDSNDPEQPETAVPITLEVLGPAILEDRFEALP